MTLLGKMTATCLVAITTMTASGAFAHGAKVGAITIGHPYAVATPPGATTSGAYLKDLLNEGTSPDALVAVTSAVAEAVQIHDMRMDGDVMRMRAVPSVGLAPGRHVAMQPGGGMHLMFIGLKKPWVAGDRIPATLQFEHAGKVDVLFNVEARGGASVEHVHAVPMP